MTPSVDTVESVLQAFRDMFGVVQAENAYLRTENESLWESIAERDEKLRVAYEQLREIHDMEVER